MQANTISCRLILYRIFQIQSDVMIETGDPGEVVVKVAKDKKAQLVVMGTRGQGLIRRTFMGSVSDYVVHHCHCPMLICRQ